MEIVSMVTPSIYRMAAAMGCAEFWVSLKENCLRDESPGGFCAAFGTTEVAR
jgi:hypothetical protein